MTSFRYLVGLLFLIQLAAPGAQARRAKTLAFTPDPSCLSNMLVEEIEKTLVEHLKVKRVKVIQKEKDTADITVNYFIVERKAADEISVQLDGRAFEKSSGKLVAEGMAVSEPHPADEEGKVAAARQAARDLALSIAAELESNLFTKGKGRRIMLQLHLGPGMETLREEVLQVMNKTLAGMSVKPAGSTSRNLVLLIRSAEPEKDLAETIEKALSTLEKIKMKWVLQSSNSLILNLAMSGT